MVKRVLFIFVLLFALFSLVCCGRDISAIDFMTDFSAAYPLDGRIYYASASLSEEGYMDEELFRRIYAYEGDIPEDFAIYLNSRPERGAECGIFKASDGGDIEAISEFCFHRIKLLSERENTGIVLSSGRYVFYSTLDDTERARELFYRLIK